MQSNKRKRYQKDTTPTDDIITLIHLVRQNPALYNYKLQPNQRRRIDVLNGWAQIAAQIGNKYTVEECRRKWKNLRDTYHQYRLRKPKMEDGLSKWRYAKELEFLSNVYQPKLKSNRQQHFDATAQENLLQGVLRASMHDDDAANSMVHHHSNITLVNDDAETFILTAYEESVNDDVATIDHGRHDDRSMTHMELTNDNVEDVEEIVKHEHASSLDDDGATGVEVDYEEVCLYEEAANTSSAVDCETIIGGGNNGVGRGTSSDTKQFQYIDTNDFCIESINTHTQLPSNSGGGGGSSNSNSSNAIVKAISPSTSMGTNVVGSTNMISTSVLQVQSPVCGQIREELDLFFDFLKKKMQWFTKEEITAIQVEFLNCVLRREAENNQKNHKLEIQHNS